MCHLTDFQIPYWAQFLQALATPAIALLAAVIGICQWRTAHAKVVLDLFDRRMKIYGDCRSILDKIISSPSATTTQDGADFIRASADAEFLYGDNIVKYLEKVADAIFDLATSEAELKNATVSPELTDLVAKSRASVASIKNFYKEDFRSILRPYMNRRLR